MIHLQARESIALNALFDAACRKKFAHPRSCRLRLTSSLSSSIWRVDLYVFAFNLSLTDCTAFLDGMV